MESVWDYPRPPALERATRRVLIRHAGVVVAESERALRILETSHPPTYYVPPADVNREVVVASPISGTFCEWKGRATYWDVLADPAVPQLRAAWSYARPVLRYRALRDHVAFYPSRVDEVWLDDERVTAQPGDFYGGWITSDLEGPFKGAPGTLGW